MVVEQNNQVDDPKFQEAMASIQAALDKLSGGSNQEREELRRDIQQLQDMHDKLASGRVEVVLFGEISTGKSALINALVGKPVAEVDVQGGWTKEVRNVDWVGAEYHLPGFANSELVLIDTPGINEVQGKDREELAEVTARRADLVLFVVDSDLNETEYASLVQLAATQKPIILVFNKKDLYSPVELQQLLGQIRRRVQGLVDPKLIVTTAADPRPVEVVYENEDGTERTEWEKPPPHVEELKTLIIETLDREGLGLIALNAAMFAADKTDRMAAVRVALRDRHANAVIHTSALSKAVVVALVPGMFDVLSGVAIDATMIVTLSRIYGMGMSMAEARRLVRAIVKAAGVFALGELTSWGLSLVKALTIHTAVPLTALPQAAAAGFSSYIIGQAAKYYFEHGGSWGSDSPKKVVKRILDETDRESVMAHLKEEIKRKIGDNRHAQHG